MSFLPVGSEERMPEMPEALSRETRTPTPEEVHHSIYGWVIAVNPEHPQIAKVQEFAETLRLFQEKLRPSDKLPRFFELISRMVEKALEFDDSETFDAALEKAKEKVEQIMKKFMPLMKLPILDPFLILDKELDERFAEVLECKTVKDAAPLVKDHLEAHFVRLPKTVVQFCQAILFISE